MKKLKIIVLLVFIAGLTTSISAADFTGRVINVPIRWSGMESNIPDAGVLSFGTDQDISWTYDTANDEVDIDGPLNVVGITITGTVNIGDGTGEITMNAQTNMSCSDKNITNVGDIALDTISADGSSFVISDNFTNAGNTVADLGIVTTVDINGGSIDGAAVGAASASSGAFTTLGASGLVDFASTGGSTGSADFDVAGYAQFAGTAEIATVDINGGSIDGATGSFTTLTSSDLAHLEQLVVMRARDDDTGGTETVGYIAGYFSGQTGVGGSAKTYGLTIEGSRLNSTPTLIGDIDDAGLKIRLSNYATANTAGYTLRGIDSSITNKGSSAFVTNLSGGAISVGTDSGGTATQAIGLSVANNLDGEVTDLSIPLDVRSFRQAATVPTKEAIARFRNGNTTGTGIATGILLESEAGAPAYIVNGIDMSGATITGYDIILSNGETIDNTTNGIANVVGSVQNRGAFNYAGVSASTDPNTYVLDATPNLVVTAPTKGQVVTWCSDTAGDGASTVSVDGVVDTLQDRAGNATAAGDIIDGGMVLMIFDGTSWRLCGI